MEPTPEKAPQSPEPISWEQIGKRTSLVSGVFSLIVLVLLIVNHVQSQAADPLRNRELHQLKAQLVRTPKDAAIQKQIRALDLDLRQKHFRHQAVSRYGTWLLCAGALVFLVTYKPATALKKVAKPPKQTPEQYFRELSLTRYAVGALGIVVAVGALALSSNPTTYLASATSEAPTPSSTNSVPDPAPSTAASYPTFAELKQNWPRFRGPFGAGISAHTNIPLTWDATSGEGILWKIEVPISGPSSPVLWGDRIFLTGANATNREVYCYDLSGKLLWQKPVDPPRASAKLPNVMEDAGGFAPSTPCTDGQRIYAIFANGDVAAFDYSGNPVWARNIGLPDNMYGHAASLEMYQDRLLVQFDQAGPKDGKSKILALDAATGKTVLEIARELPASWATPIVVNNGQKDILVTCGDPWVIAYDAADGKELWRAKEMGGEVLPSPIYSEGVIYTAISGEKLSAIRADGTGDVTKTHVAWTAEDGLPDIVGPLCDGPRVYLLGSDSSVTCYDTKDGKKLWEKKELELNFKGCATLVGDKIYIITENGVGVVLQAGNEYKELARSALGEEVLSTPAFADGKMFIRGKKHLFCIGEKAK